MTYLIENWQQPTQIRAIQTTSCLAQHQSFDLQPKQSKPELIKQFITDFNLPHEPIFLQQVHGNQIVEYTQIPKIQMAHQADACFTRKSQVICTIMTADCLPVLLTDTIGSFVAAVHCGWRSLYANILQKTLHKIKPDNPVLAWFGPYIQQLQYQVDEDFVAHYLKKHPNSQPAFTPIYAGKSYADLNTLAQIQLIESGVTRITSCNLCTYSLNDYYSWRQNNTHKRMASLIWLDSQTTHP